MYAFDACGRVIIAAYFCCRTLHIRIRSYIFYILVLIGLKLDPNHVIS